jgi:hypothetical protein
VSFRAAIAFGWLHRAPMSGPTRVRGSYLCSCQRARFGVLFLCDAFVFWGHAYFSPSTFFENRKASARPSRWSSSFVFPQHKITVPLRAVVALFFPRRDTIRVVSLLCRRARKRPKKHRTTTPSAKASSVDVASDRVFFFDTEGQFGSKKKPKGTVTRRTLAEDIAAGGTS